MVYYGQELYHHGILGQKWGVRRYQNSDGSLTPAGKQRYKEISNSRNAKLAFKELKNYSNKQVRFAKKMEKKYEKTTDKEKKEKILKNINIAKKMVKNSDILMSDTEKLIERGKQLRTERAMAYALGPIVSGLINANKTVKYYNELSNYKK